METANNINMEDLDFTDMEIEEIHHLAEQLLEERKYSLLRQMLSNLNSADVALLFDEMDKKEIPLLYRPLPRPLRLWCSRAVRPGLLPCL